jgi:membrane-associated phospholipid phosphatase
MVKKLQKLKSHWSQKKFRRSVFWGLFFLIATFIINSAANSYTLNHASAHVTDLILDNVPVFNVNFIFVEGFSLFWAFIAVLQFYEPKTLPFVLKSVALFIFIRSLFIMLTHLAIPPLHSFTDPGYIFKKFASQNDLFFSSHTGSPFLFALIYWKNNRLRTIFIALSIFFGAAELLGHLHYSIDVFAAFFIAYGIFHIARTFFKKDFELSYQK